MIDYTVIGPEGAEDGRGSADDLRAAAGAKDAFVWVELDVPTPELLTAALEALGLDRFSIDPAHKTQRRPKVETVDGAVLVLVKTVWYIEATRQVETGDLALYTDGRSLVTVRRGMVDPVPAVRRRLADDAGFRAEGLPGVVHALFDAVIEQYDGAVEDLADDVSDLERAIFSGERVDRNQEIYFLIRETLEFQNAVSPLVPFARSLKQRHGNAVVQHPGFGAVAGHLLRVDAAIETCMSLLTTVLTAHQGQIGTWQNEDTKKISAWAAIAIAPTIVAGIYGMNFDDMPELHWALGYPLSLVLMALVCVLLYRGFRRNGWL
ncbi:magnesium and cobalt transport protein CorA [Glycomyces tritici]|uniref:Magnesium and cobalt transport protein CorA n=1 Tax=Glycomyces tritici TaxID=2665176 RepID=A0ABT7YM61_9ACTN|nr:magnesium and cobalt transport protein CorA [Glycomyces tritici]MDN3239720.1 magnesium and cobalt transport protein CorA [Glycomyces tritici]